MRKFWLLPLHYAIYHVKPPTVHKLYLFFIMPFSPRRVHDTCLVLCLPQCCACTISSESTQFKLCNATLSWPPSWFIPHGSILLQNPKFSLVDLLPYPQEKCTRQRSSPPKTYQIIRLVASSPQDTMPGILSCVSTYFSGRLTKRYSP